MDVPRIAPAGVECCLRCDRLAVTLREYANLLGLRDWEVQIGHDAPIDPEATAEVQLGATRKVALVRVCDGWEDLEPDEKRHALAHELGHALLRDLMEAVREGVLDEMGGVALRVYLKSVEREHERLADVLARVMGPVLPLP